MNTIGLDLHKRESQLCISHDGGTITERRIATTKERSPQCSAYALSLGFFSR